MNEELVSLLINPYTGNALKREGDSLVDRSTGEKFPIRDGVPFILREDEVTGLNREYQQKYDWLCYFYDFMADYLAPLFGAEEVFNDIAENIEVDDGDWVLETSIGTGKQVENLLKAGKRGRFFGLDISRGMLKKCRRNAQQWDCQVELVQGNAETLPFQDEIFDMVFHIGGINFFNDKEKAIHEMIRVARPGARLYVGDETEQLLDEQPSLFNRFYQDPGTELYAPPLDLIPDEMENVNEQYLWDDKMYLISFEKPE